MRDLKPTTSEFPSSGLPNPGPLHPDNSERESPDRQNLAILGSTGSIGRSTLEVVRQHGDRLQVVGLAAFGHQKDRLLAQVHEFKPPLVAVVDEQAASELGPQLPAGTRLLSGAEALVEMVSEPAVSRVVAAVVGAAGLPPVMTALRAGKDVALANKESLVVGGRLLKEAAVEGGAAILPVDSEHGALHQALRSGRHHEVRRLVLTASGGPFRQRSLDTWHDIKPKEALAHPTWKMGSKISIDSATLMNKGLELIEAYHLFDVAAHDIDVVVHPQSTVHSLVEFRDGSFLAQLAVNDMAIPIQYALSYPERWNSDLPRLEPSQLGSLDFEPVDEAKFPAVGLARESVVAGESAPAVLNAANEEAVMAFLADRIPFPRIVEVVRRVLHSHRAEDLANLEDALEWDRWGRREARRLLSEGR